MGEPKAPQHLTYQRHVRYFKRCLDTLPSHCEGLDTSRPTLLFFALNGLDVLGALDQIDDGRRAEIVDWIYALQFAPQDEGSASQCAGFRGSFCAAGEGHGQSSSYDSGHLAMTYSCLCCLLILGDDLARVDRRRILADMAKCQKADGSFCPLPVAVSTEADVRYVFCAAAVRHMLGGGDSCFDVPRTLRFLHSSLSYEGAFGQGPSLEAHGGSTYCGVAALCLLNRLWDGSVLAAGGRRRLTAWALRRQTTGLHGRANKPDDSCYSFWIGATLKMLHAAALLHSSCARRFTLECQDRRVGGFAKYPECQPDLLHASFSVSGLSLLNEPGLNPINPALNLTVRACEHLNAIRRAV